MLKFSDGHGRISIAFVALFLAVVGLNQWVFSGKTIADRNNRVLASDESLPPSYLEVNWEARASEVLNGSGGDGSRTYGQMANPMDALLLGDLQGKEYDFDARDNQIFYIEFRPSQVEVRAGASLSVESLLGAEILDPLDFLRRHRQLFDPNIESFRKLPAESGDQGLVKHYEFFARSNSSPLGKVVMQLDFDNRLLSLSVQ